MTDAEINEAVARALGWRLVEAADIRHEGDEICDLYSCAWVDPDGDHWADTPNWEGSLDACFRDLVPEALERLRFPAKIVVYADETEVWLRAIHIEGDAWSDGSPVTSELAGYAGDPSPSRALCLAWLKTKEAK